MKPSKRSRIGRQQTRQLAFIRLLRLIPVLGFLYAPAALSQCVQNAVSCASHATLPQRTCQASVQCNGFPGTTTGFIMVTMSNNVISCTPTSALFMTASTPTFVISAVANTTAPASRSCGWYWYSASGTTNGNLSISEADGLPVELMQFSIDDGEADMAKPDSASQSENPP